MTALEDAGDGFFEFGITEELHTKWPILAHGLPNDEYNEFLTDLATALTAAEKTLTVGKWSTRFCEEWLKCNNLPDLLVYTLEYFFHAPRETHKPKGTGKTLEDRDVLQDRMFLRDVPAEQLGYRLGHFTTEELEAIWHRLEEAHKFYFDDHDTRTGANFCSDCDCTGRLPFHVTIIPGGHHARFSSLAELESELREEIARRAKAGFLFSTDPNQSGHNQGDQNNLKPIVAPNTELDLND